MAKWLPQLLLNYRRKSTHGFSTTVILLDLTGSLASLLELIISSLLAHDPRGIIGNPAKLGLSLLTMGPDCVFILQRFVLYGPEEPEEEEDKVKPKPVVPGEETPLL